ncbi:MAG: nitroreductase family protein [Bacilli bacterium]|nr:nitroreductase family protein [Bacilli bacterium]
MEPKEKLIRERHSVRSYLDKEIEQVKINELNKLISSINEQENLNIQLILNDGEAFDKFILHYGRLKNCKNYIALIGKKDSSLDEKVGYNGEKIVLKAQELGLNTCWVAGTYKKALVKADINKDEKLVCVIAIGYGETNGVIRKSKTIDEVTDSNNYPEWYRRGIEFALLAPTALNEQKFKFEYIDDENVKVVPGRGAMTKIDLGIVKYHFELGANKKINWQ